jgi:hypothetical protein
MAARILQIIGWMPSRIIFLLVIDDWLKEIFASRMESWEEGLGRTSYKIIAGNDGLRKGEVVKANLFEEKRAKCRNDRSFGLNVEKL